MNEKKLENLAGLIMGALFFAALALAVLTLKLGADNPFAAAHGLFKIIFTDEEYAEIGKTPKVIPAKPGASLERYMESRGYFEDEDARMGSVRRFVSENGHDEYVDCSQNRYYSKWRKL